MTFSNAIAGPSRLPLVTVARSARAAVRSYATEAAKSKTDEDEPGPTSLDVGKGPRSTYEGGYEKWLYTVGWRYKTPEKGARARWLGGEVPFPSNPSFRPPPPLSNDLQNTLARELRSGKRTVGQISQAYSVSKARIEAIRKLKAVEDEFRRQDLPLQTAFQDGMETLLGVRSPLDPKTKALNMESVRREETLRTSLPGTAAELEEEQQNEMGKGGSFANISDASHEGLQKDAWEFKSEATILAEQKAAEVGTAPSQVKQTKADSAEAVTEAAVEDVYDPVSCSTTVKTPKTVFRFIDTSSQK